jgi:hypothetical protein
MIGLSRSHRLSRLRQAFSMLCRHLMTDHKMTPEQQLSSGDLPPTYPLVAPDYARRHPLGTIPPAVPFFQ